MTMIYNLGNRVVNNYLVSLGEEDNRFKKTPHKKPLLWVVKELYSLPYLYSISKMSFAVSASWKVMMLSSVE